MPELVESISRSPQSGSSIELSQAFLMAFELEFWQFARQVEPQLELGVLAY